MSVRVERDGVVGRGLEASFGLVVVVIGRVFDAHLVDTSAGVNKLLYMVFADFKQDKERIVRGMASKM